MALLAAISLLGIALTTPPASAAGSSSNSLTVLEYVGDYGDWPGLDPATDTQAVANSNYLNAIYGDLFLLRDGGKLVPDLATGYRFLDGGKTFEVSLRHGVKFQDGTPFNAQAVKYNIIRDLNPKLGCLCDAAFPLKSITTQGEYTVLLHLTRVDSAIPYAFFRNAPNWIASPTAMKKMGEKAFALKPVGAGPFEVVSDSLSNLLVLKKYPGYWQSGHPFLDSLTFKTVGTDQSAYEGLLSGSAQAYQNLTTYSLVKAAKQKVRVSLMPSINGAGAVQLNTASPPFNSLLARQAVYYATNVGPIVKTITNGLGTVTESPTEPGGLYYTPKVPGYPAYNLAKAKAAVQKLGGLSFSLLCGQQPSAVAECEALVSGWAQAGIKATIKQVSITDEVTAFKNRSFDAVIGAIGGADPTLVTGYPLRYESTGSFSGVHDPKLDKLIAAATATLSVSGQNAAELAIFRYLDAEAYSPMLWVDPLVNLSVKGVSGPGLTTPDFQTEWQDVKAAS